MNEKLWETAAPLVSDVPLWKCRDALPFQFDDGLCLCELPEWARSQDTLRHIAGLFGSSARKRTSPLGFLASSRWAVDQPIRDERDAMRRRPDYLHRDRIYFASVALHLARPSAIGFHLLLNRDPTSPATYAIPLITTQDPFLPLPQYGSIWSTRRHLEGARLLFLVMVTIPRPSVVFTALRCLSISLAEEMWEVRTILAWMGVEALFAPPREKKPATAPLLARLRYYLSKVAPARWFSLKDLAHLYAERSDIVHGARFGKVTSAKSMRTTYQSERVLSLALRAVLGDPKEVSALCGPDREKHLSAIQEPRPSPRGRAWSR